MFVTLLGNPPRGLNCLRKNLSLGGVIPLYGTICGSIGAIESNNAYKDHFGSLIGSSTIWSGLILSGAIEFEEEFTGVDSQWSDAKWPDVSQLRSSNLP